MTFPLVIRRVEESGFEWGYRNGGKGAREAGGKQCGRQGTHEALRRDVRRLAVLHLLDVAHHPHAVHFGVAFERGGGGVRGALGGVIARR